MNVAIALAILLVQEGGSSVGEKMSPTVLMAALYVFMLAAFLGYQIISRVPPLLHTPLMSATNAISAISVVGALVIAGSSHSMISSVLGFIAVVAAMTNVVGGFIITDRMLGMFRREEAGKEKADKDQRHTS
ncbi:MAG TPA: NAD(P) transhydrogenase subunit alpha [Blastocatellia bacterium]|nr:NAD(P) transhydrogenase subunit alpha [Blastocatellia bacterium]